MFAIEKPFPQYNFIHLAMDFSDAPYLELTTGGQTKLGNKRLETPRKGEVSTPSFRWLFLGFHVHLLFAWYITIQFTQINMI